VLPGILRTLIVLLPFLIVLAHVGAVHGAQDAPDLMQTLVAKDATLNNELDLIEMRWVPGRDRRELALGFGVEKIVANNLVLEVTSEWEDPLSTSTWSRTLRPRLIQTTIARLAGLRCSHF
jgi:hypothetical protein